jgi:large subunit ribosomal protein L14
MIQMNSRVFIADNTGAKSAEMIRRIGQNKKTADVGDIVVCAVKESGNRCVCEKR